MAKCKAPALERGLKIIRILERKSLGMTKSEISATLELPYSSVFNLLNVLEQYRYVRRDEETAKYHLGPRIFSAELSQTDHTVLRSIAGPLMTQLIEGTPFTTHLAILQGDEAVYIEKVEPKGFFKLNTWVGQRLYIHSSAVGKALLVDLKMADLRRICRGGLERRTDNTIVTIRKLYAELRRSRERGYTLDDEEDQLGGRCVAAPIRSSGSKILASLGVSGLKDHLSLEAMHGQAQHVLRAAGGIQRMLSEITNTS